MMIKTISKCPKCGEWHDVEVNPAAMLGAMTSELKAAAARENGKKGGRPRKDKGVIIHVDNPQ